MPYDRRPSDSGRPQRSGPPAGRSPSGSRGAGTGHGRPTPRPSASARPRREDGQSTGRGSAPRRDGARPGGRDEPRRYDNDGRRSGPPRSGPPRRDPRAVPTEDGDRPRRYDPARSRPSGGRPQSGGRDRVPPRRVEAPRSAAQIRSMEVKAARGPREPRQQAEPPPWEREQWVDDGPLRSAARKATARAQRPETATPGNGDPRIADAGSKPVPPMFKEPCVR